VEGHEHSIHFTPEIGGSPVRPCFCGLCNGYEYNIVKLEIQGFFSVTAHRKFCHCSHGTRAKIIFSISLSLCHKKALSLSFYLLYNRIYMILCRMLHRQLNHSGDIAFAHLNQLPDTRQPHFIITKEVSIL